MKKHHNLDDVELFGQYTDPFENRRTDTPTRPQNPIETAKLSYIREYKRDALYYSWMGHSSVFLHINNANILIDPIFSDRCSPFPFLGPKRFEMENVEANDLPKIDLVLITHNHYDHLDKKTIKMLDKKVTTYVVASDVGKYLRLFGVKKSKIVELDWYQQVEINGVTIKSFPTQHDTSRYLVDRDDSLWCSYLISSNDYRIYHSGDGGFHKDIQEVYKQIGQVDVAFMECGQYNTRWHAVHMFPEETALASSYLNPKVVIPIHYGKFVLSNHGYDEPAIRFSKRADELKVNYYIPKVYEMMELEKEEK